MSPLPQIDYKTGAVVIACCAAACGSGPHGSRDGAADHAGDAARVMPADAASSDAGGRPGELPLDEVVPELGATPRELVAGLADGAAVPYAFAKWWLAPAEQPAPGTLIVSLDPQRATRGRARLGGIELHADVTLRDRDGAFDASFSATFDVRSAAGRVLLRGRFEQPELAEQLGHPAPAAGARAADPFELLLSSSGGSWQASLVSIRRETWCPLLGARRPESLCDLHPSALSLLEERVQPIELDAKLAPDFTPRAAIDALRELDGSTLTWPDGTSAALTVDVVPDGRACLAVGQVPGDSSGNPAASETVQASRVIVPLVFEVQSADGRVLARLPGDAQATLAGDGSWDGRVEAASALIPVARIAADGGRVGFDVPPGSLSFLSLWLNAPLDPDWLPSQLGLQVYAPDPGVPPYPGVDENASNRASCFGAPQLGENRHALITQGP